MTFSADLPGAHSHAKEASAAEINLENSTGAAVHLDNRDLPHAPLWSNSFLSLLIVQFLTVLNDHTFRWLVVPIAKPHLGPSGALALGLAAFTLPFIILATPAGFLADRFSKANVIRACKTAEVIIMGLGFVALITGNMSFLIFIVFLTGALAALFSPAKSGCVPELVDEPLLSKANGWMGLVTVAPAALGFLLGNLLANSAKPTNESVITVASLIPSIVVVMGIAIVGWVLSFYLKLVEAADPTRKYPWNPFVETVESLRRLKADTPLFRTALGIAFFWILASLAQLNVDTLGAEDLQLSRVKIGIMGMMLVLGVGGGSVLAGMWSGGHVELGIVPLGAIGMAFWSVMLCLAGWYGHVSPENALIGICGSLFFLGISAGLFDVPLESYLQHQSEPQHLGQVVAATNFLAFSGILIMSGLYWLMIDVWNISPSVVFLIAGIGTVPVAVYIVLLLPSATVRFVFWLAVKVSYRVRTLGIENIPRTGGALLTPNHISFVDGILLMITIPRPVRFIIYADFVYNPKLHWLAKIFDVIPIKADGGPKTLIQSLRTATDALKNGELVCIFPEGALTRTGHTHPFQAGMLRILKGTDAPIIPIFLHGLWGSIFSYRGGKFFWKWPRKRRHPVSIVFGKPLRNPQTASEVFHQVQQLGVDAVHDAKSEILTPARKFIRSCKSTLRVTRLADSSGVELTGGKLLAASLAMRRVLLREVLGSDEPRIGILLPATAACAIANLAVTLTGRTAVNLNFTTTEADMRHCVKDAGVRHVLTSRKFLEKRPVDLGTEFVFLEDLKEKITNFDKLAAAVSAYLVPAGILERSLGLLKVRPDDIITIIFTSGSTGEPKGVMLSNYNVSSTVDAADQIFNIQSTDCILGVLPIFHSFGYVASFWLPLCVKAKVAFHFNPLDARVVGEMAQKYGATILFGTPTFLRGYLKRCEKEQFKTLDLVVVGAEKMPLDLAEQFREKFGIQPSEGYGTTETSGPACVNVADHRCAMVDQKATKLGTVGRPMPGVTVRAIDVDSRQPLAIGTEGMICVKGSNIMSGYLNQPEKTASLIRDGWYETGDMGLVDADGFVHITGRLSRFSKIGGEMVPHLRIEEYLLTIVEDHSRTDAGIPLAVTSVPDPKKGERLIVLHLPMSKSIKQVIDELAATGLPTLWIPSHDGFVEVTEIPILGTGKLDLKGLKQMALNAADKPSRANV
ncbi:acyl-[ACP]--phospholipid O-acyltransferase [Schlesneria paludicola]|uniref:acyl-[ACP]--phospholipid O-acyltransferase n=1 Tax=Schlesneria paludicola TaxID=360056 RepID=UPI00029A0729|nr:acyl-[ACP]--phospholipid O-acyltransferase [Schlesneria paludicola]